MIRTGKSCKFSFYLTFAPVSKWWNFAFHSSYTRLHLFISAVNLDEVQHMKLILAQEGKIYAIAVYVRILPQKERGTYFLLLVCADQDRDHTHHHTHGDILVEDILMKLIEANQQLLK